MMATTYGDVPLLDPVTGRFPDQFAPPAVAQAVTEVAQGVTTTTESATEAAQSAQSALQASGKANADALEAKEARDTAVPAAAAAIEARNEAVAALGAMTAGVAPVSADTARGRVTSAMLSTPPTPYGHNDVIHPSVVHVPGGWNGYPYWLAITPLNATGDSEEENPCIYVSTDGDTWIDPPGLTNPIDESPTGTAYNADTELLIVNGLMYCFYTENHPVDVAYRVKFRTSVDGVVWSAEQQSSEVPMSVRTTLSPGIVHRDGVWHMWTVDSKATPKVIEYRTATAPTGPWVLQPATSITPLLPATKEAWHLTVASYGDEWHMLLAAADVGSSGGFCDLYFLTSPDGVIWERSPAPIVPRITPFSRAHYRTAWVQKTVAGALAYDLWLSIIGQVSVLHRRLARAELTFSTKPGRKQAHALEMLAAKGGDPRYIVTDSVGRQDGPIGVATTGQTWVVAAGDPVVKNGTIAPTSSAPTLAVLESGESDVYVEMLIRAQTTGGDGGVVVRSANSTSYVGVGWWSGLRFRVNVNGTMVRSEVVSNNIGKTTLSDDPVKLGVLAVGDQITAYLNDIEIGTWTEDRHMTATRHGFYVSSANTALRLSA